MDENRENNGKIVNFVLNNRFLRFCATRPLISVLTLVFACFVLLFIESISPLDGPAYFLAYILFPFGIPALLTIYNIFYLFFPYGQRKIDAASVKTDIITALIGTVYLRLYAEGVENVLFSADWSEQLYNYEVHTPLATEHMLSLLGIVIAAVCAYSLIKLRGVCNMPPLISVLCIGALYLLAAASIVFSIHTVERLPFACIFTANIVLICAKTVKKAVFDWQKNSLVSESYSNHILELASKTLHDSRNWPWLAIIAALPLLGIVVCVLCLFGQRPDSLIRIWTETAEWTFSTKIPPQNIYMDQHYLCTVAAGGHKKVVKPLRIGMRHGHRVIVNRQLCVANAFEQLLEERTPRFHRAVRGFYDRFGYPIAKHIRSPYTADVIWFLMKPLEWFFLTVLYLCDTKPENRIAVQYPHAPLP